MQGRRYTKDFFTFHYLSPKNSRAAKFWFLYGTQVLLAICKYYREYAYCMTWDGRCSILSLCGLFLHGGELWLWDATLFQRFIYSCALRPEGTLYSSSLTYCSTGQWILPWNVSSREKDSSILYNRMIVEQELWLLDLILTHGADSCGRQWQSPTSAYKSVKVLYHQFILEVNTYYIICSNPWFPSDSNLWINFPPSPS